MPRLPHSFAQRAANLARNLSEAKVFAINFTDPVGRSTQAALLTSAAMFANHFLPCKNFVKYFTISTLPRKS
jgi:hypothetical protein